MYGEEKFVEFQNAAEGKSGWQRTFKRLDVNALLLPTNSLPLPIVQSEDWRPVYWDDLATVFVRATRAAPALAQQLDDSRLTLPFSFESNWDNETNRAKMVAAFERKLDQQPDCLNARVLLARCRGRMGEPLRAAQLLVDARTRAPHNMALLSELARWLTRAGKHREAVAAYRDLLRVSPRYTPAHYGMGVAYAAMGEWAEAERSFRRALRAAPGFTDARRGLIDVLRQQGRMQEARELQAALPSSNE